MFHDPNVRMQISAFSALIACSEEERAELCKHEIHAVNGAIQEIAINTLSAHSDLSLINDLKSKIKDQKDYLHTSVEQLLAAFTTQNHKFLIECAKSKNLFAISLLGRSEVYKDTLVELLDAPEENVSLNAAVQLLTLKDPRGLPVLFPLFTYKDDFFIQKVFSPGKTTFYYTLSQGIDPKAAIDRREASERAKDELLIKASELDETEFLSFAEQLFATHRKAAVPILCRLLENIGSPKAIELLQNESEHVGSPFIRTYAKLTLFHSHQTKELEEALIAWIYANKQHAVIEIRPTLFWEHSKVNSRYALTFEETSQLFTDIMLTLVETKSEKAIELLLDLMLHGNSHNRYLLAGMLLHASN